MQNLYKCLHINGNGRFGENKEISSIPAVTSLFNLPKSVYIQLGARIAVTLSDFFKCNTSTV